MQMLLASFGILALSLAGCSSTDSTDGEVTGDDDAGLVIEDEPAEEVAE
ncbi:MAG: hypothetical protein UY05_C0054G0003 [Candidatus Peregrinibacteria bacterium GW2011_GWA2_47_7]|nr:MAG: hypothetical protein UY05_C0054G0003 [Candidatus Peregrinibacteria bacterium GW2011_GWA2_47_7]